MAERSPSVAEDFQRERFLAANLLCLARSTEVQLADGRVGHGFFAGFCAERKALFLRNFCILDCEVLEELKMLPLAQLTSFTVSDIPVPARKALKKSSLAFGSATFDAAASEKVVSRNLSSELSVETPAAPPVDAGAPKHFPTDTQISAAPAKAPKVFERYSLGDSALEGLGAAPLGSFDQFCVNMEKYKVGIEFEEGEYRKALRESEFSAEQKRYAEAVASEIQGSEKGLVGESRHAREERGLETLYDSEEEQYAAVEMRRDGTALLQAIGAGRDRANTFSRPGNPVFTVPAAPQRRL